MEIELHQARTRLSQLIERAMAGEEITIVHAGRPVVRMLPADPGGIKAVDADDGEIADLFADALGG